MISKIENKKIPRKKNHEQNPGLNSINLLIYRFQSYGDQIVYMACVVVFILVKQHKFYLYNIRYTGCSSSVGSHAAWDASGTKINPLIQHILL